MGSDWITGWPWPRHLCAEQRQSTIPTCLLTIANWRSVIRMHSSQRKIVRIRGRRDYDITEINITESDVAEFDITENDITESDITETNIT